MFIDTELRPQGEEVQQDQEVRELLLAAADVLERDGWCQYTGWLIGIGHCPMHAMAISGSTATYWRALDKLAKYIGCGSVAKWNDAHERTLPEVLAALRGAAGL